MLHISRCASVRHIQWDHPHRSISSIKSWQKTKLWPHGLPRMTFEGAFGLKGTVVITSGPNYHDPERYGLFLCAHWDLESFSFSPLTYNGEVTALPWPCHWSDSDKVTDLKKIMIYEFEVSMPSRYLPSFMLFRQLLSAVHDRKHFWKVRSVNET